jgi:hypothetical protein
MGMVLVISIVLVIGIVCCNALVLATGFEAACALFQLNAPSVMAVAMTAINIEKPILLKNMFSSWLYERENSLISASAYTTDLKQM